MGTLIAIITLFSIIQSMVGIGLLVFGTPTLLILGYSFETALAALLPAALSICLLQVWEFHQSFKKESQEYSNETNFILPLFTITTPCLIAGLVFVLVQTVPFNLQIVVGGMLIFTACTKIFSPIKMKMKGLLEKHQNIFLGAMGLIHGVSNMGGGPLSIMASTLFPKKAQARHFIAVGYIIMCTVQLLTLMISSNQFDFRYLGTGLIGAITYKIIGQRIFNKLSDKHFHIGLTSLIFFYGIITLWLGILNNNGSPS